MNKEKYGFVYIWRDKGKNRYYIGSHWGTEDDGYICSSTWMRNSYQRRPQDFRRKILFKCFNKKQLLIQEEKWLSLIDNNKLGSIYYNRQKFNMYNHLNMDKCVSEETRRKQSEAKKGMMNGEKNPMYGKPGTKGHLGHKHSEETKKLISKKINEAYNSGKLIPWNKGKETGISWNKGIVFSEESRKKMSEAKINKKQSKEHIENAAKTRRGKKCYNNGIINKFCFECPEGFFKGKIIKNINI